MHKRKQVQGVRTYTHRDVYEKHFGPIPEGMIIHHTCEVQGCIDISHLKMMTPSEHVTHHNKAKRIPVAQIHPEHGVLKVWPSMAAADEAGFHKSAISSHCIGKYKFDTHYDCWWMKLKG